MGCPAAQQARGRPRPQQQGKRYCEPNGAACALYDPKKRDNSMGKNGNFN